jgi:hypothetical protein
MRKRDPVNDKILSYQRDRRNVWGENPKSSRRAIRFRKRWVNRSHRHAVREQLDLPLDPEELQDQSDAVRRKYWRKMPDAALGDVVGWKLRRRGLEERSSRTREEARRRGRDDSVEW